MSLLREFIRSVLLLTEGRLEDVKKKYPGVDVYKLSEYDPSGNNAYLSWMAKQVASGSTVNEVRINVNAFHRLKDNLKQRDINSFKDISDLRRALSNAKMPKVKGADLIAEDENWFLLHVKQKCASIQLGARDTSWCITQSNRSYWEDYARKGAIFFFCVRKIFEYEGNDKFAISIIRRYNRPNLTEFWQSNDSQITRKHAEDFLNAKLINTAEKYADSLPESFETKIYKGDVTVDELDAYIDTLNDELEVDSLFNSFDQQEKTEKMKTWVMSRFRAARIIGLNAMTPIEIYNARAQLLASPDKYFVSAVVKNLPINCPERLNFAGSDDFKTWSNACFKLTGTHKADFVEAAFAADKSDFINKFFRDTDNINGLPVAAALLHHPDEVKAYIFNTCIDRVISDIAFSTSEEVINWEKTVGENTLILAIELCMRDQIPSLIKLSETDLPLAVIHAAKLKLASFENNR